VTSSSPLWEKNELMASIFLAPPYVGYIAAQLVAWSDPECGDGLPVWEGVVISAL